MTNIDHTRPFNLLLQRGNLYDVTAALKDKVQNDCFEMVTAKQRHKNKPFKFYWLIVAFFIACLS